MLKVNQIKSLSDIETGELQFKVWISNILSLISIFIQGK